MTSTKSFAKVKRVRWSFSRESIEENLHRFFASRGGEDFDITPVVKAGHDLHADVAVRIGDDAHDGGDTMGIRIIHDLADVRGATGVH
jgi:hypothetical protein